MPERQTLLDDHLQPASIAQQLVKLKPWMRLLLMAMLLLGSLRIYTGGRSFRPFHPEENVWAMLSIIVGLFLLIIAYRISRLLKSLHQIETAVNHRETHQQHFFLHYYQLHQQLGTLMIGGLLWGLLKVGSLLV